MSRFLTAFGALLGIGGSIAGAVFLFARYGVYRDAISHQRAPLSLILWQLSLTSGALLMTLSVLFGLLFVLLGRTLARVQRLEAAAHDATPEAIPLLSADQASSPLPVPD